MSGKRYNPYYLNDSEALREEMRQRDMVESITGVRARERVRVQEKEKAPESRDPLERLSEWLPVLEMLAQDLAEITKALKDHQIKTT